MSHKSPCRLFALLFCAVLMNACAPGPAAAPSPSLPSQAQPGVMASPSAQALADAPTPAGTASPSGATVKPIAYPDAALLDRLEGYDLTLHISFKGTQDGRPVETSNHYTHRVRHNPPAQFTTVEVTGVDAKPTKLVFGSAGNVQYAQTAADQPCTAQSKSAGASAFNPATLLRPVRQAKFIGSETIGGTPARHYALDANSYGPGFPAETTGDLWLADAGGFVVKYVLRVRAGEAYFGKGNQGEQTTTFELAASGAAPLVLPAGCPPVSDLPAMSDASDLERTPWGLSYLTAADVRTIISFYIVQMKPLGWALQSSSDQGSAASAGVGDVATPGPGTHATAPSGPRPQDGWASFVLAGDKKLAVLRVRTEKNQSRVEVLITTNIDGASVPVR